VLYRLFTTIKQQVNLTAAATSLQHTFDSQLDDLKRNFKERSLFFFGKFKHELTSLEGKVIKQIASGATHYLILTADNELYSVGSNSMGMCHFVCV
jgi:alpha-tubulin suppressor-like RCC1 family protein